MPETVIESLKTTADWRVHLAVGDIVSFRFPYAEEGAQGRPKARPCLVLEVRRDGAQTVVLLAYGTTSRRRSNVGAEIQVRKRFAMAAGLDAATRFVGCRRVRVTLDDAGFARDGTTRSAVLGRLEGAPLERLDRVRERLQTARELVVEAPGFCRLQFQG